MERHRGAARARAWRLVTVSCVMLLPLRTSFSSFATWSSNSVALARLQDAMLIKQDIRRTQHNAKQQLTRHRHGVPAGCGTAVLYRCQGLVEPARQSDGASRDTVSFTCLEVRLPAKLHVTASVGSYRSSAFSVALTALLFSAAFSSAF